MGAVEIEREEGVAILKLNSGKKNPINPELVEGLSEALKAVKEDEVRGIVLTSSDERFFSIGLDVPKLINYDREKFREFIRNFNLVCLEIYTLPKPVVAAVNGHATAGGCILALCCDYRYMSEGRNLIGLNEVKLGLSVPYLPVRILQQISGSLARDVVYNGEFFTPEKALEIGIVDAVYSKDELLEEAIKKAKTLGEQPREAFAAVKKILTERIKEETLAILDEDVNTFVSLWFSEEGQKRLREVMKSF